jgi:hypothetical protein
MSNWRIIWELTNPLSDTRTLKDKDWGWVNFWFTTCFFTSDSPEQMCPTDINICHYLATNREEKIIIGTHQLHVGGLLTHLDLVLKTWSKMEADDLTSHPSMSDSIMLRLVHLDLTSESLAFSVEYVRWILSNILWNGPLILWPDGDSSTGEDETKFCCCHDNMPCSCSPIWMHVYYV